MYREALKRNIRKPVILQDRSQQSVLLEEAMFLSWVGTTKYVLGGACTPTYMAYRQGRVLLLTEEAALQDMLSVGIRRVKEDPLLVKKFMKRFRKEIKKLNSFTEGLFSADLKMYSNKELYDALETYYQLYDNAFPYGEPISWPLRFDFVKELEVMIAGKVRDRSKLNEYMAVLITPDEPSFVNKEEEALLRLALWVRDLPGSKEFFSQSLGQVVANLPSRFPEVDRKLNEHTERFCWIPSDYESDAWDKRHFVDRLRRILTGGMDIEMGMKRLTEQPANIRKHKDEILKELGLEEKTVRLFEAVADSGYLLDLKKELFTLSHYHMRPWFSEVAKRLNITVAQLRFMTRSEVRAALINNVIDTKELDERHSYCVIIVDEHGMEFFYKEEAKEMFGKFSPTVESDKTEIQGSCAQPGTVRGYARVMLSSREQSKMKDGEILVTTMTTPDFVPAMKKAKAIVTDEGGITCHAALVARELGTPCVVGTKLATRFFRTGDLIELHAASGIVRRIGER